MKIRVFLSLIGLTAAIAVAHAADIAAGWQAIADYRPEEALRLFDRAVSLAATAREGRLGRGVALLAKQPVTANQVDEARRIFTEVADGGSDDVAQAARFFLGRVAQHHQETPDPEEAARQFRRLIAEHEHSAWTQSALSRLALLQLYHLEPALTPEQRIAETEKLLAVAHVPAVRGELHIALAEAIFFYRLPAGEALPHLLAAEPLGGYDRVGRADLLIQIAELSRLAGKKEQAGKFYRLFLKENPRDTANYIARRHLAEMERTPIMPPP